LTGVGEKQGERGVQNHSPQRIKEEAPSFVLPSMREKNPGGGNRQEKTKTGGKISKFQIDRRGEVTKGRRKPGGEDRGGGESNTTRRHQFGGRLGRRISGGKGGTPKKNM